MVQQFQVEFDNKNQMERVRAMVTAPEMLLAVFDEKGRGTGFVGITDRRIIFMDQGVIRKKKLIVSLPYSRINSIATEDNGGALFGTSYLLVMAGNREYDFEFHSKEKAHRAHQLIIWNLLQNERAGMLTAG